jgi:hypothetical protein
VETAAERRERLRQVVLEMEEREKENIQKEEQDMEQLQYQEAKDEARLPPGIPVMHRERQSVLLRRDHQIRRAIARAALEEARRAAEGGA